MYILPLATIGGTYFANSPTSSRASFVLSVHNTFSVSASNAYSTPATVACTASALYGVDAQTMPFWLLLAETERKPPGMAPLLLVAGAVMALIAKGVVFNRPVVALNSKPRSLSFSPH